MTADPRRVAGAVADAPASLSDSSVITSIRASLNTDPNIDAPDDFYQELLDMHRDLSQEQSALVNAKLILLLANHVGDPAVLREAMRAARQDIAPDAQDAGAGKPDRQ